MWKNSANKGEDMRVLLINEHTLQQNLLRIALEQKTGIKIIGEYLEGRPALRMLAELEHSEKPDLVIQGIRLPDIDGLTLTQQLRQLVPAGRILVVTGQEESCYLIPFLLWGGHGYLNSYTSDEEFYQAVEAVMDGRIFLTEDGNHVLEETCQRLTDIKMAVMSREVIPETPDPAAFPVRRLSEREKQVLHLFVNGYKSSEIGSILYMSANTVETHKKRIKEKLNLTRKAELTAYAKENGLFEDWD